MNLDYQIKNLFFSYQGQPILEDINLELPAGKTLAIVGPNGGGKTTFLKILLGLLKPQKGEVLFRGRPIDSLKRQEFPVGYLPQLSTHGDINHKILLPVLEVVELGDGAVKMSRKERKEACLAMLNRMGIEHLAHKLFSELSGGQKQRVLFARALISKPQVLLLDEPSTGVDPQSQVFLQEMLLRLKEEENMTLILVTHDLNIIPSISDMVGCLNRMLYVHENPEGFVQCPVMEEQLQGGMELFLHGSNIPHRMVGHHHEHKDKKC